MEARHKYFNMLKPSSNTERMVHKQIAKYLNEEYPTVMFITDLMGEYFTEGQRKKIMSLRCEAFKILDLTILEPNGIYTGLVLELKKDDAHPLRKDGALKKSEHLEEQAEAIRHLRSRGYYADFAVGYVDAANCIDNYFNRNLDLLNERLICQ